jgi:hypothetical protein
MTNTLDTVGTTSRPPAERSPVSGRPVCCTGFVSAAWCAAAGCDASCAVRPRSYHPRHRPAGWSPTPTPNRRQSPDSQRTPPSRARSGPALDRWCPPEKTPRDRHPSRLRHLANPYHTLSLASCQPPSDAREPEWGGGPLRQGRGGPPAALPCRGCGTARVGPAKALRVQLPGGVGSGEWARPSPVRVAGGLPASTRTSGTRTPSITNNPSNPETPQQHHTHPLRAGRPPAEERP